jgi:hypothetical protein
MHVIYLLAYLSQPPVNRVQQTRDCICNLVLYKECRAAVCAAPKANQSSSHGNRATSSIPSTIGVIRRPLLHQMSSSAPADSSSATSFPSAFSIPISEKLTKANYSLWRKQVLPAICAAQLEDLLTGHEATPAKTVSVTVGNKEAQQPNPAYAKWVARDQSVLGYLLSSLTREALLHVTTCTTAADVWRTLASLYSMQTRARSVNTRIALATTRKNQLSISDYFAKMR